LLTVPAGDRQDWERTWREYLKVSIVFETVPAGANAPPRVQGIREVRIENRTPCLLRVTDTGKLRNLRDGTRTTGAWDIKPHQGLVLRADTRGKSHLHVEFNGEKDLDPAGGYLATQLAGELCHLQAIPANPDLPARALAVDYKFGFNKRGNVLFATYVLR
jgi:hypothetical protein